MERKLGGRPDAAQRVVERLSPWDCWSFRKVRDTAFPSRMSLKPASLRKTEGGYIGTTKTDVSCQTSSLSSEWQECVTCVKSPLAECVRRGWLDFSYLFHCLFSGTGVTVERGQQGMLKRGREKTGYSWVYHVKGDHPGPSGLTCPGQLPPGGQCWSLVFCTWMATASREL